MARILLSSGEKLNIASDSGNVIGNAGVETVVIFDNAPFNVDGITLDQNVERADVASASSAYKFQATGNVLKVFGADGKLVVEMPINTSGTQTVAFGDGAAVVKFETTGANAGKVTVGGVAVSSAAGGAAVTGASLDVAGASTHGTALTPTFSLVAGAPSVDEGSTATFTLTTTNVADGTSVPYTLSGINADDLASGSLSGVATVTGGKATISVVLKADATTEGAETLTVSINGQSATAAMTVNDTSTTPLPSVFSIAAASAAVVEGDTGASTDVVVTITRTNPAQAATVEVNFTGTADAADYTATDPAPTGSQVAFAAGETSKTLTVSVKGDTVVEADETIIVSLSNASGSNTIATPAASVTVTITNDDGVGTTYTLTANVDTPPAGTFTTFEAPQVFTPGGTDLINSLQDSDVLTGTDGATDVLNATIGLNADSGDLNITPTLAKIETVNVKFDANTATLDLQDSTGINSVNMMRVDFTGGSNGFLRMAEVPATMSVHNTNATANLLGFTFTDEAVRGNADSSTMTLHNAAMATLRIEEDGAAPDQGIENLGLVSSSSANTVGSLQAEDLRSLTVTGDADLRVATLVPSVINTQGQTEAVFSQSGFANAAGSFDTLNASAFTGNLDVDVQAVMDANVDGTSGNNVDFVLTGGAGDDVFRVGTGLNRVGGALDNDTVDGGAGNNTVRTFTANTGLSTLVDARNLTVSNVQTLDVRYQGVDLGATLTADTSAIGGLEHVIVRNEATNDLGAATTFQLNEMSDAVAAGGGVTILHSTTGHNAFGDTLLNIDLADASGTETAVVTIADGINLDPTFDFILDVDGKDTANVADAGAVENLTIVDTDSESNEVRLQKELEHTGTLKLSGGQAGQDFAISGNFYHTFGTTLNRNSADVNDDRIAALTVDASGQASNVFLTLSDNTAVNATGATLGHNQKVTGGTGNDTFDFRNFLTEKDTIDGNTGVDRVRATFDVDQTDPLIMTRIETLRFGVTNNTLGVNDGVVVDMDRVTGVQTLEMIGSTEALGVDATTIDRSDVLTLEYDGAAGEGISTITFGGRGAFDNGADNNFNGVTVVDQVGTNTYTGAADAVTLAFNNNGSDSAGADYATGAVTLNGVERLTVAVTDLVDTALDGASVVVGGITSDTLQTLTVTSPAATTTGAANTTDVALGVVQGNATNTSMATVNANGVSGNFAATLNSMGNNATVTASSAGNHSIDLGLSLGSNITVTTGTGNDTIIGSVGANVINAGNGNNTIDARGGNDVVTTGTGNDIINGGGDDDAITSGAGNDLLRGGEGTDNLQGGAGNDTFVVVGTLTAVDNAGYAALNGVDTDLDGISNLFDLNPPVLAASAVDLSGGGSITSLLELTNLKTADDLEAGEIIAGGEGIDTVVVYGTSSFVGVNMTSIENLVLKSHAIMTAAQVNSLTTITGSTQVPGASPSQLTIVGPGTVDLTGTAQLSGLAQINLTSGAVLVLTDAEALALVASGLTAINVQSANQLQAAPGSTLAALTILTLSTTTDGNDVINVTNAALDGNPLIDGKLGSDTLVITDSVGPLPRDLEAANIVNVEKVTLAQGSSAQVTIFNGAGVETTANAASIVKLGTGGQTFTGSSADDEVVTAGNDTVNTLGGTDTITVNGVFNVAVNAGAGDDTVFVENLTVADAIDGGSEADTVVVTTASTAVTNWNGVSNVEVIVTLADSNIVAQDTLVAAGATLATSGALAVGAQFDFDGTLEKDGSFAIFGNNVGNILKGGQLDDFIFGGAGNDVLTGNDGRDTFAFSESATANGADRITDFTSVDVLDFSAFVAGAAIVDAGNTAGSIATATTGRVFNVTANNLSDFDTAAEVATLFNPSAVAGDEMIVIIRSAAAADNDTLIYYVDNGANSAVTAAEVQLVGTLENFDLALTQSNIV